MFSTTTYGKEGTSRQSPKFPAHECVRSTVEGVMRAVNFLITASIFCSLFISLALVSAVLTGAAHSQVSGRLAPPVALHHDRL
jgi:hypothetical protein